MNGTLIINKPEDWTSHDVVAKLRRILGLKRIGHTGTLDPFATGVLVVCLGSATRLVQFLVGLEKEYLATVRLGFATDTQDRTGKPITPVRSSNAVTETDVKRVLAMFEGEQRQLPPMYSAKKVGGETLHKAARAGRVIERELVAITIYEIAALADGKLTEYADEGSAVVKDFQMRVRCSSGTYIRTLANDIGERLGVGAHLATLHRTAVGHFSIEKALTLEQVEAKKADGTLPSCIIGLADSISHLPSLVLSDEETGRILNGRSFYRQELSGEELGEKQQKIIALCSQRGDLVALGEIREEASLIQPKVVFPLQGE